MDVPHEAAVSQRAREPGSDLTSYPPDVGKLTDWDLQLSVIAEEASHLQQELSRLRDESETVARLLLQREGELEQKTESLLQLTAERDHAEKTMSAANASLSEAHALLDRERERIASLEQRLELRQAEHDHATALEQELRALRARVEELETLETPSTSMPPQPCSHLRFVAGPTGYALSESAEPPPRVGELIVINGREYAVASSGRSPLPGDKRPCVLLQVEPGPTESPYSHEAVEPAAGPLASL